VGVKAWHGERILLGLWLVLLAGPAGAGATFPIRVAPGGRHLVDASGAPWRVQAFAAWVMSAKGSRADVPGYLDAIRAHGFNAVYLMAMVHGGAWREVPGAPQNAYGEAPFTTSGDFTTPNPRYWEHLDWIIDASAERGIAVMLTPAYLGYPGRSEGWEAEVDGQSEDQLAAYGDWIGRRYADRANVIWFGLGDQTPSGERAAKVLRMMDAIKAVAPQPWMAEAMGGNSSPALPSDTGAAIASRIDMHSFYGYGSRDNALGGFGYHGASYQKADEAWSSTPARPVFLQEGLYEGDPYAVGATGAAWESQRNRMWSVLGGGTAGDGFGTNDGWKYVTASFPLATPGMAHSRLAFDLFASLPWWDLVPQPSWTGPSARTSPVVVTSGRGWRVGSPPDWIVAARTSNGSHVLAYVPPTGTTARTFEVDASLMSGRFRARWWDPHTGEYLTDGVYAAKGRRSFTTPGPNGTGTRNDWVLVLDVVQGQEGHGPAITPSRAIARPGASIQFSSGAVPGGATWSLHPNASGGFVTATGLYVAGPTAGVTDVVRLESPTGAVAPAEVDVRAHASVAVQDLPPGSGSQGTVVLAVAAVVVAAVMGGAGLMRVRRM
jgi:hypothetical protein